MSSFATRTVSVVRPSGVDGFRASARATIGQLADLDDTPLPGPSEIPLLRVAGDRLRVMGVDQAGQAVKRLRVADYGLAVTSRLYPSLTQALAAGASPSSVVTQVAAAVDELAALASLEYRACLTSGFVKALETMGHRIAVHHGELVSGMVALRADEIVGIQLLETGIINLDFAGCARPAFACQLAEVERALASVGFGLGPASRLRHDDRRGGDLFALADPVVDGSPAALARAIAEGPTVPTTAAARNHWLIASARLRRQLGTP